MFLKTVHGVLINSWMLKMMAIADNRHFSYDNENGLAEVIASEMQKEDPSNEENLLASSISVTSDSSSTLSKDGVRDDV